MAEESVNEWHLDKRLPLGIITAILVQTITVVYYGTTALDRINSRIDVLEKSDEHVADAPNRITILEQKFNFIQSSLSRIEGKMDTRGTP
jgi:hypothetical protein